MKVKSALLASLMLINILAFISASSAGIVAYWPFDEGKSNDAKDASGNGNDGEVHDAEWVDGKFGKALKVDGNFLLVPNDDSYNFDQ